MTTNEPELDASERDFAIGRIKKQRDFQSHLAAFVVVNAAVWVIWATTGSGYPWPAWITGLWAIGLVLNAWDVYVRRPITEAEVQRELDRTHRER